MLKKNKKAPRKILETIVKSPNFRLVEAYKTLRTNILFSVPAEQGHARRILLTSANPGDGKTTVSVNTAITFSQTQAKVVLVDADLRKPTTHRYFGISSSKGLSNILSGQCEIEECIHKVADMDNLYIIPSGVLPPNPSELLSGKYMDKLFAKLDEMFDVILIDTPPVTVVSDALSICKYSDGVLIVVSNNRTTYPDLRETIKNLEFADAKILGVVFNRSKTKVSGRNKKYGNYYRHKSEE